MSIRAEGLRTPVARARGLGSAKTGLHHWWLQRLTALALVPLTFWFVASIIGLAGADYARVAQWLRNPISAGLLVALIIATFHHAQLGMQVVYEDYVRPHWAMVTIDLVTKFICFLFATISIFAVLKIAFGG